MPSVSLSTSSRAMWDGRVARARLALDGGMVMIGPAPQDSRLPRDAGGGVGCAWVVVADAHHRRAAVAGVVKTPGDRPDGGREHVARDPEGGLRPFGTHDP